MTPADNLRAPGPQRPFDQAQPREAFDAFRDANIVPPLLELRNRFDALEAELYAVDRRLDGMQHLMKRLLDRWDEIETYLTRQQQG